MRPCVQKRRHGNQLEAPPPTLFLAVGTAQAMAELIRCVACSEQMG